MSDWGPDRLANRAATCIAVVASAKALLGLVAYLSTVASGFWVSSAFVFVLLSALAASLVLLTTSPILAALLAVFAASYGGGVIAPWWSPEYIPVEIFLPAILWLLAQRSSLRPWVNRLTTAVLGFCLAVFVVAAVGVVTQDPLTYTLAGLSLPALVILVRGHRWFGLDPRVKAIFWAMAFPLFFIIFYFSMIFLPGSGNLIPALDSTALGAVVNGIAGFGALNVARVAWQERDAEMQARQRIKNPEDFISWGLDVFREVLEQKGMELSEEGTAAFREIYAESGVKAARVPRVFVLMEDQIRTVMSQQAAMAIMAARWQARKEITADDVTRAVRGHQVVKNRTPLCPPTLSLPTSTEEAA